MVEKPAGNKMLQSSPATQLPMDSIPSGIEGKLFVFILSRSFMDSLFLYNITVTETGAYEALRNNPTTDQSHVYSSQHDIDSRELTAPNINHPSK